jgi:outer membrane lipoprotein carrier protein
MRFLFFLLVFLSFHLSYAQTGTLSKASDSDPKAKKMLDALKKEFTSYKSVEINFDLVLELKEQAKQTQKGKLIQQGKKYFVNTPDQDVYCDGKNIWLHLKQSKEVQLSNYEEKGTSEMMFSPNEAIKMYESGKFVYVLTGSAMENGINANLIEFKPLDRKSEYSKMRLAIDPKTNKMVSFKIFAKDGSRYTLNTKTVVPNKSYTPDNFVYNAKKYPGVKIQDLRID